MRTVYEECISHLLSLNESVFDEGIRKQVQTYPDDQRGQQPEPVQIVSVLYRQQIQHDKTQDQHSRNGLSAFAGLQQLPRGRSGILTFFIGKITAGRGAKDIYRNPCDHILMTEIPIIRHKNRCDKNQCGQPFSFYHKQNHRRKETEAHQVSDKPQWGESGIQYCHDNRHGVIQDHPHTHMLRYDRNPRYDEIYQYEYRVPQQIRHKQRIYP